MDTIKFTFTPTDNKTNFDYDWDIKNLINKIKGVIRRLESNTTFVADVNEYNRDFLDIDTDYYTFRNAIIDILKKESNETNEYNILGITCIKDKEWTKERNKNYQYEVYVKYTFKPEYAKIIQDQCSIWLQELESLYAKVIAAKEADKKAKEERQVQFNIIKVYTHVNPKGGEDGTDGYYDADISDGQQAIRFVARNVFDFGFYTYPKHFEGTDDIFNSEKWTELEHKVSNWLTEFSPFTTGIRM